MNGRYESFTVRVWARGREIVRGEVHHVPSGESMKFIDLNSVVDFFAGQVGIDRAEDKVRLLGRQGPSSSGSEGGGAAAPGGGAPRHDINPRTDLR